MKKIILGGIGLVAIIYVSGFFWPDHAFSQRDIIIDANQEKVFSLVSDYNNWDKWSPWHEKDPQARYIITGAGQGHKMTWESDIEEVGHGSQTVTLYNPPGLIESRLEFDGMGAAKATFVLTQNENGTRVVWAFDTDMREGVPFYMKPIVTYMTPFMDNWIGGDFEKGLANLKAVAEVKN